MVAVAVEAAVVLHTTVVVLFSRLIVVVVAAVGDAVGLTVVVNRW